MDCCETDWLARTLRLRIFIYTCEWNFLVLKAKMWRRQNELHVHKLEWNKDFQHRSVTDQKGSPVGCRVVALLVNDRRSRKWKFWIRVNCISYTLFTYIGQIKNIDYIILSMYTLRMTNSPSNIISCNLPSCSLFNDAARNYTVELRMFER
jgi:hypothetical protein